MNMSVKNLAGTTNSAPRLSKSDVPLLNILSDIVVLQQKSDGRSVEVIDQNIDET